MIYQEEYIRIIPFEREKHMTEKYRAWMIDPEVTKFNSWGLFPYTKKQQEQFVKDIEEGSQEQIVWAIEMLNNNEWVHVGNCSLQEINNRYRSAEFAIVIGEKEARGKGVGTKVLKMVLDHAFRKLGLNRVWTGTAAPNFNMQRVAEKVGMKCEGVFREGTFLDGKFEDIFCYGILASEWNKHR